MLKRRIISALIFLLLASMSIKTFANADQRRDRLLQVIDQELKEVTRLNKQTGARNPNLMLRMAELLLEKARLLKEKENQRYLSLSPETRQRSNKNNYYKDSAKYFKQAEKVCFSILKRFKRFKGTGDVYFILAFNAKEFNQFDKAKRYFQLAAKYSPKSSTTRAKAEIALADIYYNNRDYKRAIPLYQRSLKSHQDKWWTKDSFNLAWSYFRIGKKRAAIALMNQVLEKSKQTQYVDMSEMASRDLTYFYTESGKINQAIKVQKGNSGKVGESLMKMGKYLTGQGKFAKAQNVFQEALKQKVSVQDEASIHIELLNLYERFGKGGLHLKSAKHLNVLRKEGVLSKEQRESLLYHVQRRSALIQKTVAGKTYRKRKRSRATLAKQGVEYFEILSEIEGQKRHQALFHAAETYYAAEMYDDSIRYYNTAFSESQKAGDTKISNLALNGMMAALGQKGVSRKTNDEYLDKAYLSYLSLNPRSKKSFRIYQRLFKFYVDKKNIADAEKTLLSFKSVYPNAVKTQEAMLATIMDYHKDRDNKKDLKQWVKRISDGEFKVSRKYAKKVRLLLLTMEFEDVEKASSKGDKKRALIGYVEIYKSPETSKSAKKNAAYNIAVLFHELGDIERTKGWTNRALSEMGTKDVQKFETSFLAIANEFFNRQKLSYSIDTYNNVFKKLCQLNSKNKKVFFKNAYVIQLAENQVDEARQTIENGEKCGIDKGTLEGSYLDMMKAYVENERWTDLQEFLIQKDSIISNKALLVPHAYELFNALKDFGKEREALSLKSKIMSYYQQAAGRRDIPLESLDIVAQLSLTSLDREILQLKSLKLSFPENIYNQTLQNKFRLLDSITSKGVGLLKLGSGRGIVRAYKVLVETYEYLANEVLAFTPANKPNEYVSSFKREMQKIVIPIQRKANEFKGLAKNEIEKHKILSLDNGFFLTPGSIGFDVRYFDARNGVFMDRGWKR